MMTLTDKRQIKRCSWLEMGKAMEKTEYAIYAGGQPLLPRHNRPQGRQSIRDKDPHSWLPSQLYQAAGC